MKWLAWLGCACVALATAGACGGEDGKKSQQREDGGAAGETTTPSVAGDQARGGEPASPEGGAAGVPAVGQGGEAGSAGAEPGGAGGAGGASGVAGAGGAPSAQLSLTDLQGNWYGRVLSSYACESAVRDLALSIEGAAVTSNWYERVATGQVQQEGAQAFTLGLSIDSPENEENPQPDQQYRAQLFVHPSGQYAVFVARQESSEGVGGSLDIAILQKGEAPGEPSSPVSADFAGDWQGTGLELNDDLSLAEEFPSSGAFVASDGLGLDGTDRDGDFSGSSSGPESGAWWASFVPQGDAEFGIITLMSNDLQVLALAMLRRQSVDNSALCDLSEKSDMSLHKFGLWTKAK